MDIFSSGTHFFLSLFMQIGLSGSPLNSLKPFCFTLDGFIGRVCGFMLFLVDSGDFLRGSFHVERVNSLGTSLVQNRRKARKQKEAVV